MSTDISAAISGSDKTPAAPGGPADRTHRDACPRCGASDVVMSLLTAMNKYLACPHCRHRWHLWLGAR